MKTYDNETNEAQNADESTTKITEEENSNQNEAASTDTLGLIYFQIQYSNLNRSLTWVLLYERMKLSYCLPCK